MAGQQAFASLLTAEQAQNLDKDLMAQPGFTVDQLMELAGLSVASAITKVYPPGRVLVVAGPGNNGGDGLVAARHLWHFGYKPAVFYPKPTNKELYTNLVEQCRQLDIPFLEGLPPVGDLDTQYDCIIDAIFGFSFSGDIRPPFDTVIRDLKNSKLPVISVDCPSGWHVEEGDKDGVGLQPEMLVSLTAPKRGARFFKGAHHYLGGRFVPPGIMSKYNLVIPSYPGTEQCVRLDTWGQE